METLACSIRDAAAESFRVSTEVVHFFREEKRILDKTSVAIAETIRDDGRKLFMDEMGVCSSDYRQRVYDGFSGNKSALEKNELLKFIDTALAHLNHTLSLSRGQGGLFHSYNLIQFGASGFGIKRLPEMLEGQVAILSSGFLGPQEGLALLDSLRKSDIYCADRNSYLLYPDKELPSFLEKNRILKTVIEANPFICKELESGRKEIVEQDVHGTVHFNGVLMNAADLQMAIERAGDVSKGDEAGWFEVYETVFRHREFTGRSSTMYKYEGLGCIYWHMVSKLLLAITETIDQARYVEVDDSIVDGLIDHFNTVKEGLGVYKSPTDYGAIPTDPYSHTPAFVGAQQPGMTGQVKEDVITRFWELGVVVKKGCLSFEPFLLGNDEFFTDESNRLVSLGEKLEPEELATGSLAFSLCGIPVIYQLAETNSIHIFRDGKQPEIIQGTILDEAWSRLIFARDKRIRKILVNVSKVLPK